MRRKEKGKRAQTSIFGLLAASFVIVFLAIIYAIIPLAFYSHKEISVDAVSRIEKNEIAAELFSELSEQEKARVKEEIGIEASYLVDLFYCEESERENCSNLMKAFFSERMSKGIDAELELIEASKMPGQKLDEDAITFFLPYSNQSYLKLKLKIKKEAK